MPERKSRRQRAAPGSAGAGAPASRLAGAGAAASLPDQLDIALEAARRGAEILRRRFGTLKVSDAEQKGPKDFVTAVDREAEEAVVRFLQKEAPGVGVMAEEGSGSAPGRPSTGDLRWVIDPLDGTTNYLHGFPHFAVSVALARGEEPLAGAVIDPLRRDEFSARRGGGAWLNGSRLRVSPVGRLADALALTGFPFRAVDHLPHYLRSLEAVIRGAAGVRRAGSAALDLCYVAAGRAELFWELKLSPWDIAAGSLLVEEAGGQVSDFSGGNSQWRTGNILATNGALRAEMVRLLSKAFR